MSETPNESDTILQQISTMLSTIDEKFDSTKYQSLIDQLFSPESTSATLDASIVTMLYNIFSPNATTTTTTTTSRSLPFSTTILHTFLPFIPTLSKQLKLAFRDNDNDIQQATYSLELLNIIFHSKHTQLIQNSTEYTKLLSTTFFQPFGSLPIIRLLTEASETIISQTLQLLYHFIQIDPILSRNTISQTTITVIMDLSVQGGYLCESIALAVLAGYIEGYTLKIAKNIKNDINCDKTSYIELNEFFQECMGSPYAEWLCEEGFDSINDDCTIKRTKHDDLIYIFTMMRCLLEAQVPDMYNAIIQGKYFHTFSLLIQTNINNPLTIPIKIEIIKTLEAFFKCYQPFTTHYNLSLATIPILDISSELFGLNLGQAIIHAPNAIRLSICTLLGMFNALEIKESDEQDRLEALEAAYNDDEDDDDDDDDDDVRGENDAGDQLEEIDGEEEVKNVNLEEEGDATSEP